MGAAFVLVTSIFYIYILNLMNPSCIIQTLKLMDPLPLLAKKWGGQMIRWPPISKSGGASGPLAPPFPTPLSAAAPHTAASAAVPHTAACSCVGGSACRRRRNALLYASGRRGSASFLPAAFESTFFGGFISGFIASNSANATML